jgi:linearmycin/streptolysin S transport system permease protein
VSILSILGVGLRRVVRDRTALFFLIVLPIGVILIIGATVRGFSTFRVGVVDEGAGQAGQQLVAKMQQAPDLNVRNYASVSAAATAMARSEISAAVILPTGLNEDLRAGKTVDIGVMAEQTNSTQQAASQAVESVISQQGSNVQAALFATAHATGSFEKNLVRATALVPRVSQVGVDQARVDSHSNTLPEGFSYSAPTMLVLFVFLNALAGGATIIETRRLGMYERMAAAPLRPSTIILGEGLTYFCIALLQAVLIVLVGALVFGVSWGNPFAAGALIVFWAMVGGSAGMLSGTLFRTPEQASSIGPAVGIALAMLGGCMWPLSIVSPVMRSVGHATPQAWAVDAWTDILSRGGTPMSILPQLGMLLAFAAGFLAIATVRMRRILS